MFHGVADGNKTKTAEYRLNEHNKVAKLATDNNSI